MKQSINLYDFERAFVNMDRNDQFTYEGKKALYHYLEQYEEDTGGEVELDVIALCCEFTEYDTVLECAEYYGFENDAEQDENDDDELRDNALNYLRDRTQVIEFDNGIIIQDF